jgi:cobalamin biosynthesis protein CobW
MKIPATVITGFLGAGKTTLIRHLIENAKGRRIALIINEFGEMGVDRELLTSCDTEGCEEENIVELANGCICCTVADDFLPTMEILLDREEPPHHIIIETSGLALPKPLVKAFNWPEIRSRLTVDGVVAVIDSPAVAEGRFADDEDALQAERDADPSLDHDNPLEEVFEDQLLCADLVVLNKADIVGEDGIRKISKALSSHMRPGVKAIRAVEGAIDIDILLGLDSAAEDDIEQRRSHHDGEDDHDHDDFESFTVELGDIPDPEKFEGLLMHLTEKHDILRIKGFLHVPGKEMRHVVQGVGPRIQRYFDRQWAPGEVRKGQLVVIGQTGLDRGAIETALLA